MISGDNSNSSYKPYDIQAGYEKSSTSPSTGNSESRGSCIDYTVKGNRLRDDGLGNIELIPKSPAFVLGEYIRYAYDKVVDKAYDLFSLPSYLFSTPDKLTPDRICLITAFTIDNEERFDMSLKVADNQRAYADAKGYSFFEFMGDIAVEADRFDDEENEVLPYWSKIAVINKLLNRPYYADCKWVVWLDDDAVVTNRKVNMEDVINHYTHGDSVLGFLYNEVNIIATTDSSKDVPLNSGVLFVKNNEWSRSFFQQVWEMRKEKVPNPNNPDLTHPYTYGDCPDQSCLHEQQAITDLMTKKKYLAKHIRIIPQRDPEFPIGINTFVRENHYDLNRGFMWLNYNGDNPDSKGREGDFIQHCSGMSSWGYSSTESGFLNMGLGGILGTNLRKECVNKLLEVEEEKVSLTGLASKVGSYLASFLPTFTTEPTEIK